MRHLTDMRIEIPINTHQGVTEKLDHFENSSAKGEVFCPFQ